jgi:hypothetical protein
MREACCHVIARSRAGKGKEQRSQEHNNSHKMSVLLFLGQLAADQSGCLGIEVKLRIITPRSCSLGRAQFSQKNKLAAGELFCSL